LHLHNGGLLHQVYEWNRSKDPLVDEQPERWPECLESIMFGLRTKKQMTTGFSPFFLLFGKEGRYPTRSLEHFRKSVIWRLLRGGRGGPSSSLNFIKIKSFLDKTILNIITYHQIII
ncbi:hypothetical protein J4Q44_G00380360, partial [Coregonus suidteri]